MKTSFTHLYKFYYYFLFFAVLSISSQNVQSQDDNNALNGYISPVGSANIKFERLDDPANPLNVSSNVELDYWIYKDSLGTPHNVVQFRFYTFSTEVKQIFTQIYPYPDKISDRTTYKVSGHIVYDTAVSPINRQQLDGWIYINKFDTLTHNIQGEIYITWVYPTCSKCPSTADGSFNIETIPPQLIVTNTKSDILKTKGTANYRIELSDNEGKKLQGFDVKVKDPFINSNEFVTIGKTDKDGLAFYNRIIPADAENGDYELTFWATKDTSRPHIYWDTVRLQLRSEEIKKTLSVVDSMKLLLVIKPDEDMEINIGELIQFTLKATDESDEPSGNAELWVKNPLLSDQYFLAGTANSNGEFIYKYLIPKETPPIEYTFEFFVKKEGFRQSVIYKRKVFIYPKDLILTLLPANDIQLYPKDSSAFIVYVRNAQNEPISGAEIFVKDSLSGKATFTKVDTTDENGRYIYSIKIPEKVSGDFSYKFFARKQDKGTDTLSRKVTVMNGFRCWSYLNGMLEFCIEGNGKWESVEGKPILQTDKAIIINDFLVFAGNVEIDTVNLSIKADGKFYLSDIPLPGGGMGSFTVAEGSYELAFGGANGKITNFANAFLDEIAGFKIKLTDLQLVGGRRADGIKLSAKMSIPGISVGCNETGNNSLETDFELKDLEISKTKGIQLGGFNVQNLGFKSFPNFCLKELTGSYNDDENKLAYGANVKIPFGEVGGGIAFVKGNLDSLGFRLEAKFPPLFVIGTSTVGIMGFFGHISSITKPEIEFELGGVLSDITSESLYKIDMSGFYKSPSTIGMKGDGTIFKDPLTDKWQIKGGLQGSIDFAEYQMEISGNINVGTKDEKEYLLKADANMKYNMKQSRLSGAMNGAITLPKFNNGWPYDWINSTLGLPKTTTASARLIYGNMKSIWGQAYFPSPVGNLSYILDLKKSWGDDGYFFFERNSPSSKINKNDNDEIQSILSNEYNEVIQIPENCEKFVVRVIGNENIPVTELQAPDGTVYLIESIDTNKAKVFYSTLIDEKKSFWAVLNPVAGQWNMKIHDSESNFKLDYYIFESYPNFRIETTQNSQGIIATWDKEGLDPDAKIDIFVDKDTYGENGAFLKSVSASDGNTKIELGDSLSLCKYFVYAVYLGKNYALSSYSEKPVTNVKSILPAPQNFTAKFHTITGKNTAEWTPTYDKNVVGYTIFSVEEYGGYEQVVASVSKEQSKVEFKVPSHLMYKVKIVSYDKNGLMGCPTEPQKITTNIEAEESANNNKNYSIVFPNPASDFITISIPANANYTLKGVVETGQGKVQIFNILGIEVLSVEAIHELILPSIDISHLTKGIYFIRIGDYIEKFMVVR
jgi:hypothetical protein